MTQLLRTLPRTEFALPGSKSRGAYPHCTAAANARCINQNIGHRVSVPLRARQRAKPCNPILRSEELGTALLTGRPDRSVSCTAAPNEWLVVADCPTVGPVPVAGPTSRNEVGWIIVQGVVVQVVGDDGANRLFPSPDVPLQRLAAPMAAMAPWPNAVVEDTSMLQQSAVLLGQGMIRGSHSPVLGHLASIVPSTGRGQNG